MSGHSFTQFCQHWHNKSHTTFIVACARCTSDWKGSLTYLQPVRYRGKRYLQHQLETTHGSSLLCFKMHQVLHQKEHLSRTTLHSLFHTKERAILLVDLKILWATEEEACELKRKRRWFAQHSHKQVVLPG
ncbi:hypothetical protein TRVL_09542 [Trypanosoma vivax]|nr:hypothetical protein TRVL_09542 [Trypanosoma vivax]